MSTGKPEGKGPLGKAVSRWQDNIKTNPKVGWEGEHQIHLTHERDKGPALANTKFRVPYHEGNRVLPRNCQLLKKNSAPWGWFVISGLLTDSNG